MQRELVRSLTLFDTSLCPLRSYRAKCTGLTVSWSLHAGGIFFSLEAPTADILPS